MFGFFVALFGGLYYGGKYLSETIQEKAFNFRLEVERAEKEARKQLIVPDPSVEEEMERLAYTTQGVEEVAEDLIWIHHNNPNIIETYRKNLIPHARQHGHTYGWRIYLLLMSKRGYIPNEEYLFGIVVTKTEYSDEEVRLVQRIEHNMQQFQPWVMFYVWDGGDYKNRDRYKKIIRLEDRIIGDKARAW